MPEIMEANIAASGEIESAAAPERIPIEERTDVTVDELEQMSLPYNAELYDGRIVYKMPNSDHGIIQSRLSRFLDVYLDENLIGYVMTETNFRLWPDRPRESRIPDVAFVKKERMSGGSKKFPAFAPDLAIEVISPDDNFLKVLDKVDDYLEQGAQMAWLVISTKREVWVCTKEKRECVRDVLTAPDLLPGFELPVEKIFERLPEFLENK